MFLNKIKDKYHYNLLYKFIESGDINEIKKILKKNFILDNKSDLKTLNNYLVKLLSEQKFEKLFNKNLVWVNSFEDNSCTYINKFLINILSHNNVPFIDPSKYIDELYEFIKSRNIYKIDFEDICNMSYVYQYFITEKNEGVKILNSSAAFFETANNLFFTHYFLTQSYIYIIKNPYEIYKRNKLNNISNDKINNMQELTAGDANHIHHKFDDKYSVSENRQDWSTNVTSWTNPNVIGTFRGYILKEEDLESDPLQKLSEITSHLIQSGIDLELDYSYLQNYISENPFRIDTLDDFNFSKKELKILDRDIGEVASKFLYKPKI